MKFYLTLTIALLSSCVYSDDLHNVCPATCYTGPQGTVGVGICKSGLDPCNEDYSHTGECVGEILPDLIELCDGIDNTCDGHIDTQYGLPLQKGYPYGICMLDGVCKDATALCVNSDWVCSYPNTYEVEETRCDGLDNDCDGEIDEELYITDGFVDCYTGPVGSEFTLPCHRGFMSCIEGESRCVNQTIPYPETCDAIDNDCNGLIDDVDYDIGKYDIVIALDKSGSMMNELIAVKFALEQYVDQFSGNSDIRFAVIEVSGYANTVSKIIDFSDIADVIDAIDSEGAGNSTEPSYDSIYYVCDREINELNLNWTDDAWPIYLGFTDEEGQTEIGITQDDIIAMCLDQGVMVFQWSQDQYDFEPICNMTGGKHFMLAASAYSILNDLNTVIASICGGGEN